MKIEENEQYEEGTVVIRVGSQNLNELAAEVAKALEKGEVRLRGEHRRIPKTVSLAEMVKRECDQTGRSFEQRTMIGEN